jgi:hypothetical protein
MTKSAVRNGETREDGVKSYPRESALVWKTVTEVLGLCQSGSSQCAAAMQRNEGASQRYSGGWRFGLIDARVPALTAKRFCRFLPAEPDGSMRQTRRALRVLRVATWRKWSLFSTIEHPPRRQPVAVVTARYKAVPKGDPYAGVSGTSHLWPAVWGTQLDQSSRAGFRASAMKGRSAGSSACQPVLGVVSPSAQAAIGPERASSRSNPGSAKQHLYNAGKGASRTVSQSTGRKLQQ